MHSPKRPTYTSQVLQELTQADDFRTLRHLASNLRLETRQVSASLHHLYQHRAVDCLASNGDLYWYATPSEDTRTRIFEQITEKDVKHPRKPGSAKRKPRRKPSEPPKRD